MRTLAVIPARGGSKGLFRKNICTINGEPLLVRTLRQLRQVEGVDKVLVSTDDREIAEIAIMNGASAPFLRPESISGDTNTTDEVLRHALQWCETQGESYHAVLWAHVNMPFRKVAWLSGILRILQENPDIDSSFIVVANQKNFWARHEGVFMPLSLTGKHPGFRRRQDFEGVFQEECGLGCVTRVEHIRAGYRVGPRMSPYPVDDELATVDIHDEFDLWLADQIATIWPSLASS